MKALHHNGTWELVSLPPNRRLLVANGSTQLNFILMVLLNH
jgi:hypothetical protein